MDIQYPSVLNTRFETEGLIRPYEMRCLNHICTHMRESILERHIVSDTLLLLLNLKWIKSHVLPKSITQASKIFMPKLYVLLYL